MRPGSHCPHCRKPIRWVENIPLVSYFLLGGKCSRCGRGISWRYPAVEALNALIWAGLAAKFGWQPFTFKAALFCSMMLILIFTDMEHMILPDEVTKGGMAVGFALAWFIPLPDGPARFLWMVSGWEAPTVQVASLVEAGLAAVLFGGMLWLLREVYYRVRGIDGLGLGDVKMAAMMGAFWGIPQTLLVLLVGSLLGAITGAIIVTAAKKAWTHELPFGSYLGAAAIAVTFFSEEIFGAYWRALGGAV